MERLYIFLTICCAILLVMPNVGMPQQATNAARGQIVATEATVGAPTWVRMEYLAEPPEMSPELMEEIRERVECCSNMPMPPVRVEPGSGPDEAAPTVPATEIAEVVGKDPQDFMWFANNDLGGGAPTNYTSIVGEPCVGNNGRCVFQSGNWYAALSTDFGATFSFIDPYTAFPAAAGGFCCDQIVIYDPSRDCLFWLLQYLYDGSYNNVQRLAVANSFSNIESQSWYYYDFTAQAIGLSSGHWLDFPDLVLGENYLYLTSNYVWRDDAFVSGTSIRRLPLDALSTASPVSYNYHRTGDRHSFRCTHGADTVMYWATHNSTSSIRMYEWVEGPGVINYYDRAVTTWNNAVRVAPGPDGRDWLGYADSRVLGAYVTDAFEPGGAMGFMWSASQGGAFAYPYVHVARFRVSDKTLLNEPNIWNPSYAFAYPSVNINARGHLGVVVMFGGGPHYPSCGAIIWDDYTSWPAAGGTFYPPIYGESGPFFNRSGDYVSTRPCHPYSNTWIGTSFSLQGGPDNENARPRFLWFGRERDIPRPEPQGLYAHNDYDGAVPLAWNPPPGQTPLSQPTETLKMAHKARPDREVDGRQEVDGSYRSKQTLLSYNVYRSETPGGPYTLIANVDRQYYRDEPVTNGNTYYYVVTAVYDIVEESGYSNESAGSPVSAGYYINSGWTPTPPVLDGQIDPWEWALADVVDITYPGVTPSATLYVMNDEGHLYLAVDDAGNATLDVDDQIGLYYDENHDYEWPPSGPSAEGNLWLLWGTGVAESQFRGIYGWWPLNLGMEGPVAPAPGVNLAMSVATGHVQYEAEIDLAASDLNASPGDVIGCFMYCLIMPEWIFSGYWPQEFVASPFFGNLWSLPAAFGDLELAVPPPPQNLYAFEGYHEAVPLVWEAPLGFAPLRETEALEVSHGGSPNVDVVDPEETNSGGEEKQTLLSYNVYRSDTPGGPFSLIANVDRQYYRDRSVISGNDYYYVVTAVYDTGESEYSNEGDAIPRFRGYYTNSTWALAPPTLDGLIEAAEWSTASIVDITAPGVSPPVTLYVMNDGGHLYLAVDDPGNTALDDYDQFGPYFDDDHDFEWPPSSPSSEGNFWVVYHTSGSYTDFRGIYGSWPSVVAEAQVPATGVTEGISLTSGHVQFEVDIDLTTSELTAAPGDTISLFTYAQMFPSQVLTGWWPQEHLLSAYPNDAWLIPATYGEVELALSPDIGVYPGSFSDTLCIEESGDDTLDIYNYGGGPLVWTIDESPPVGWLSENPVSDTVPPRGTQYVILSFDATGLSAGNYSTTLIITSNDPDEPTVNVLVELTVQEPDIGVSPLSFSDTLCIGESTDSVLYISNAGGCELDWSLSESPPVGWLSENPTNGSIPPAGNQGVTLSFDATGLSAGDYNTTLAITSNDPDEPTVNVPAQLTVKEPDITVSPDSFTITLATSDTLDTTVTICSDVADCVLICSLYTNPEVPWLTVGYTNVTVLPGECDTVDLHFDATGLSIDIFTTTLVVASNDPDEPTVDVPIELTVTGIEELLVGLPLPVTFDLSQNRPNPVRFRTNVLYQLPREAHVVIQVYDRTGKLVKTLIDEVQRAGYKSIAWNGQDECGGGVPSGVYFYRIHAADGDSETPDFTQTKKMIVIR